MRWWRRYISAAISHTTAIKNDDPPERYDPYSPLDMCRCSLGTPPGTVRRPGIFGRTVVGHSAPPCSNPQDGERERTAPVPPPPGPFPHQPLVAQKGQLPPGLLP